MFLASGFYMLLKTQNPWLPTVEWSAWGQRSHHLIGFLPDTLQGFFFQMSFKARRHLTCMPNPLTVLNYSFQQEREKPEPGGRHCETSACCHTICTEMWLGDFWWDCWETKLQIVYDLLHWGEMSFFLKRITTSKRKAIKMNLLLVINW